MSVGPKEVKKIAHLARIALDEKDIDMYVSQLSEILGLVDQINELDTDGIIPMAHPLHEKQRLRADEVTETNQRDELQAMAPEVEMGLYLVPQVIDNGEG